MEMSYARVHYLMMQVVIKGPQLASILDRRHTDGELDLGGPLGRGGKCPRSDAGGLPSGLPGRTGQTMSQHHVVVLTGRSGGQGARRQWVLKSCCDGWAEGGHKCWLEEASLFDDVDVDDLGSGGEQQLSPSPARRPVFLSAAGLGGIRTANNKLAVIGEFAGMAWLEPHTR